LTDLRLRLVAIAVSKGGISDASLPPLRDGGGVAARSCTVSASGESETHRTAGGKAAGNVQSRESGESETHRTAGGRAANKSPKSSSESACGRKRICNPDHVDHLFHVVHADQVGAVQNRGGNCSGSPKLALICRLAGQIPDEAFARSAQH